MATKFPSFSQGLAQDPTTRRIWYGIATAHDFESHDGMTEERLYQKLFSTHFGHLAIFGLWVSGNLFHIAWQGNFEQWVADPLHVKPIAHAIWDPHFGQGAINAFTQAGATSPVNDDECRVVSGFHLHDDPVGLGALRRLAAPSAQVPAFTGLVQER